MAQTELSVSPVCMTAVAKLLRVSSNMTMAVDRDKKNPNFDPKNVEA